MEENTLTTREQVEQDAKNGFRQGLNCSECVLGSFMANFETPFPKDVIALATGFGGGMGHTKNTCGAVTGAVMYHRGAEKSGRKGNNGGTDTGTEWYL